VKVSSDGGDHWKIAKLDMILNAEDIIQTDEDAKAILSFADMSTFVLQPETTVVVVWPPDKDSKWRLVAGNIWVNIKKMVKDGSMEIDMNQAVLGIKGTTFQLWETGKSSIVQVEEGVVSFRHKKTGQTIDVKAGQTVSATPTGFEYQSSPVNQAQKGIYKAYTWPNGDRYEGYWLNDKQNGKGSYTWPNGNRYEGDWVNGERNGKGIMTWPNGNRYEGDFVDGKRTGKAIMTWASGNRYEGDWVNGKQNGKGSVTWASGERYEGDWVNSELNGKGVYTWASGSRYEGDFVDSKRTGYGTLYAANGAILQQGRWLDSNFIGP
jgi:hypothetical protein